MMYSKTSVLVLLTCFFLANAGASPRRGAVVNIKVNGYAYTYSLGANCSGCGPGEYRSGDTSFVSKPNTGYYINNGASQGDCGYDFNAYIFFETDGRGNILPGTICPKMSAVLENSNTLIFQTAPVVLRRNNYRGDLSATFYQVSTGLKPAFAYEDEYRFRLIKGLAYSVLCGGGSYIQTNCPKTPGCPNCLQVDPGDPMQSSFGFRIDSAGKVVLVQTRAVRLSANKRTMILNTGKITVRDSDFNSVGHKYRISGYPACTITSARSFYVVNSTLNFLEWFDRTGRRLYYFQNF